MADWLSVTIAKPINEPEAKKRMSSEIKKIIRQTHALETEQQHLPRRHLVDHIYHFEWGI